jgi:hypothetical protein
MSDISEYQKEFDGIKELYICGQKEECLYQLGIFCEKLKDDPKAEILYHSSLALYQECYSSCLTKNEDQIESYKMSAPYITKYIDLIETENSFAYNMYGNQTNIDEQKLYFFKLAAKKNNTFACWNIHKCIKTIADDNRAKYCKQSIDLNCHLALIDGIYSLMGINNIQGATKLYLRLKKYYGKNDYVMKAFHSVVNEDRMKLIKYTIKVEELQSDEILTIDEKKYEANNELNKILTKEQLLAIKLYKNTIEKLDQRVNIIPKVDIKAEVVDIGAEEYKKSEDKKSEEDYQIVSDF